MAKKTRRHINAARAIKLYKELGSVAKVARRVSHSTAGVYKCLIRQGVKVGA